MSTRSDDLRSTLDAAVRDSDDGRCSAKWPVAYEPVVDRVLDALQPGEAIRAAWRTRAVGERARPTGIGLVVVTDRRVIGTDHSSKGDGTFAVPGEAVALVELAPAYAGRTKVGEEIRLLDEGGEVLGGGTALAEFQVFKKGAEPSGWNANPRDKDELVEVQQRLVGLLPSAEAADEEILASEAETATAAGGVAAGTSPAGGMRGLATGLLLIILGCVAIGYVWIFVATGGDCAVNGLSYECVSSGVTSSIFIPWALVAVLFGILAIVAGIVRVVRSLSRRTGR